MGDLVTSAPCYGCGSTNANKVGFSWWGGLLGPKMFNHVVCAQCGKTFDSNTGRSNDTKIAIYLLVGLAIGIALAVAMARS
ncbi:MAG: hypothetical protein AB7O24_34350 [Kofleriaceae bacterium]